jgi:hypothetical protein
METLIFGLLLTYGRCRWRGAGPGYIALSSQHEPLDQTDLRNGGDAS